MHILCMAPGSAPEPVLWALALAYLAAGRQPFMLMGSCRGRGQGRGPPASARRHLVFASAILHSRVPAILHTVRLARHRNKGFTLPCPLQRVSGSSVITCNNTQ